MSMTSSAIFAAPLRSALIRPVIGWFRQAAALRRQRRALARLDAALLRDIGLTRSEALSESGRPVWDVPKAWRR